MTDEIDRANEYAERERESSLALLLRPDLRKPRTHCVECGEPISPARLRIVPRAQHCIECALVREQLERHHR